MEGLRESRERQKTLVESIVTQRDMYRTLLAQATPLPRGDDTSRLHGDDGDDDIIDSDSVATGGGSSVVAKQLQEAEERLAEVTSQFEAYRKEKRENDGILQEQLGAMREQCSEFRLDNAKLSSKVGGGGWGVYIVVLTNNDCVSLSLGLCSLFAFGVGSLLME